MASRRKSAAKFLEPAATKTPKNPREHSLWTKGGSEDDAHHSDVGITDTTPSKCRHLTIGTERLHLLPAVGIGTQDRRRIEILNRDCDL
jgi:hypothetical protein